MNKLPVDLVLDKIVIDTMAAWMAGEPVWPYARIIETWGDVYEDEHRKFDRRTAEILKKGEETGVIDFGDVEMPDMNRLMNAWHTRDYWTRHYGFALPCAELLDALAEHGPIIEVGAGTGYMTRLMRLRGIDVIGSDMLDESYFWTCGEHDLGQQRGQAKTMVRRFSHRTVFCSWPSLNFTWFKQMLRAMRIGQKLIVIREEACADDAAWRYLDGCFEELAYIDIPTFPHMHDYAQVLVKRKGRSNDRIEV
jgi:hypothetical protein